MQDIFSLFPCTGAPGNCNAERKRDRQTDRERERELLGEL